MLQGGLTKILISNLIGSFAYIPSNCSNREINDAVAHSLVILFLEDNVITFKFKNFVIFWDTMLAKL